MNRVEQADGTERTVVAGPEPVVAGIDQPVIVIDPDAIAVSKTNGLHHVAVGINHESGKNGVGALADRRDIGKIGHSR